jgi:hypothetical protein
MRFIRVLGLVAVLAAVFASVAAAGGYTDASYFTPVGHVGQPYSHTVSWKPGNGCPPWRYRLVGGQLPDGLNVSTDGHITGTPLKAGTFTAYIQMYDECGIEGEGNAPFVFRIEGAVLSVDAASIKPAMKDNAFSQKLTASGGSGAGQQWSVTGGSLPAGVTLAQDGTLSGTPTAAGTFTATVQVTDSGGGTASKQVTIVVADALAPALPAVRVSEVGIPFAGTLTATGGTAPYKWAVTAGTLPEGLALDGTTGALTGTPTLKGNTRFTITVTDANGFAKAIEFPLVVVGKVTIATTRVATLKIGRKFGARLVTTGGARPFKWQLLSGKLLTGIRFDAKEGRFVGTARKAGHSTVTVQVTDGLGAVATRTLVLTARA